jgi:PAS domain S-box-containing protein
MTDVPRQAGDPIRLGGALLASARELVLTCVLTPATDVAVGDPGGAADAEAAAARAVLDTIGWPGDPEGERPAGTRELDLIRVAAVAGLGAAASEVDEAASALTQGTGRWEGDEALEDMERIVQLLDVIGWPDGSRREAAVPTRMAGGAPSVAALREGVVVVDPDGRILAANPRFSALTGFSQEELVGRTPPYPYWSDEDREALTATTRRVTGTDLRVDTFARYRRRDGRPLLVRIAAVPLPGADGEVGAHAIFVSDEQAARVTRQALRAADERFRELADMVPVQLWTTDPRGRITFANAAVVRFFGVRPRTEDVAGRFHPDDREAAVQGLRAAIAEQRTGATRARVLRADGRHRDLLITLTPWTGEDGQVVGFLGTAVDVSDGTGPDGQPGAFSGT